MFSIKLVFSSNKNQQTQSKAMSSTAIQGQTESLTSPKQSIVTLPAKNYFQYAFEYTESMRTDDYRSHLAYSDGGMTCAQQAQVDKLRSVGKQMLKLIGRKILSGSFNLTKISIPIRSCVPKTALKNSVETASIFPYFMNRAAKLEDPIQRFKLVTMAWTCVPYYLNMFLKPLNPILGQTLQASLQDGTKIYAQQISHHPPISYFLVIGPQEEYKFYGYYDFQINPGVNSLKLINSGKRVIQFKNGGRIQSDYPISVFCSTLFGTARYQQNGSCTIRDPINNIECKIEYGSIKKKPSDYFQTSIHINKKPAHKMRGTYCGYIQFDGKRHWDGRDIQPFPLKMQQNQKTILPSSWHLRQDLILLKQNKIQDAQKAKEDLQQIQRRDEKLRKKNKEKK